MVELGENIMELILQAENEYHLAIKNAVVEAEKYADGSKQTQRKYIDELEREWYSFERAETEKLEKALSEEEQRKTAETNISKDRLKVCQKQKIDEISDRLKEDVLGYR